MKYQYYCFECKRIDEDCRRRMDRHSIACEDFEIKEELRFLEKPSARLV
jgi:hypothetical protein